MRISIHRLGLFAFIAAFAGISSFSLAQGTHQVPKVRTFTGSVGVRESTLAAFPQIQENEATGMHEHENPYTPHHGMFGGEPNTIPVGTNNNTLRISSQAKFAGIGYTGYEPPDCDMGVGPSHVIATVNLSIAFFDKNSGAKQFQQNFNQFFSSVGLEGGFSDPKVFFDKVSGRFFVCVMAFPASTPISKMYVAVSQTSNPNGNWFKYKFDSRLVEGTNTWWLDYPGLGGNKDGIVITGNMFPLENATTYGGCLMMVIEKAKLLTGAAPRVTLFNDRNADTVQPMRSVDGSVDKVYAIGHRDGSSMNVYAVTAVGTNPALSQTTVTVPSWEIPNDWALSAGGRFFDSFDGRMFGTAWRTGKLVTAHTVQSDVTGSNCSVRWYDIATNNWPSGSNFPTLNQSGNINATAGLDYHMPAVNINKFGDIACMYTRSGNSVVADLVVSGRKTIDTPGGMSSPKLIETSTGSTYAGFSYRWGDYFAVAVDPSDDYTFWGFGMVSKSGAGWTTFFGKWLVTLPTPVPIDANSVTMFQGNGSTGTVTNIRTSDSSFFSISSVNVPSLGQIAAAQADFTFSGVLSDVSTVDVEVKMHGVARATGMLYLYDWNVGDYVWIKSFPVQAIPTATTTISIPAPWGKYIGPGGQIKAIVRSVQPSRTSTPYTLRLDLLRILYRT